GGAKRPGIGDARQLHPPPFIARSKCLQGLACVTARGQARRNLALAHRLGRGKKDRLDHTLLLGKWRWRKTLLIWVLIVLTHWGRLRIVIGAKVSDWLISSAPWR